MKKSHSLILALTIAAFSFSAGIVFENNRADNLRTQVFKKSKMEGSKDSWGKLFLFTDENTNTYGTENMVSGIAEIKPGQMIHPPHQHSDEEFLLVLEGTGTWSIKGEESPAEAGDLMYSNPWDMHGITNTGKETLKFFFVKWNNKGVDRPLEPR